MYQFNFFPILNFIAGTWILSMGIFLFFARRRTYIHLTYFVTAGWILGYGFAHFSADQATALFWCKFVYAAVIFIAPTMYHFVVVFWDFKNQQRYVRLSYFISMIFLYVLFCTPYFITGVRKFSWGYHTIADPLVHFIFLFFFCLVYGKGLLNLRKRYIEQKRKGQATEALRTRYFLLIYTISVIGAVDYLQDYGLASFYPAGFLFPAIGVTVAAWAILRYRLLKVNVIIAKTIIFMIVYLTVIGIPLGAGIAGRPLLLERFGVNWWLLPALFLGITATIGPFFYFFLWRRAEESMKARKFKYIQVLKDFSEDVKRVRTLDELADLIVTKIKDLVGVSRVLLYIKDKDKGNFVLKTYEGSDFPENGTTGQTIEKEASTIKLLRETNSSIVRGELKFGMGIRDFELSGESEKEMTRMDANVIIPFFYRDELVALIVLGEKKLSEAYEDEDIEVFNTLGTNAGLAIKTGLFVEELNIAHADVIASERFAAMGRLAASAKHGIDNPLNMIYNSLGVALSDIADTRESYSKLIKRIKPMMEEARRLSGTLPENSNELDEKLSVFDDVLLSLSRKGERDKEFKEELDRHKASILEIHTLLKNMAENISDDKVKESVADMAHMLSTIASNLNKVKELDNTPNPN